MPIVYDEDSPELTEEKVHIWLSGSFLKGSYTKYSDVDLAVKTGDAALVKKYIYGFVCAPYI